MKLPRHIQVIFILLFTSVNGVFAQTPYQVSTDSVDITASVTEDSNSILAVIPNTVEIKEPALVTVTIRGGDGELLSSHYIKIIAPGLTFTQPTQPSNAQGSVVLEISGNNPGSYSICAQDITYEGLVIDILDCDTLYVTPIEVPNLLVEPQYTRGTTNTLFWNSLGLGNQYLIEMSKDSDFNNIMSSSGWITGTKYEFENLENEEMYFYRVKARNSYGGQSAWSNVRFSVQDDEAPVITIISIGSIGENNIVEWDSKYEVEIVYSIEDNLALDSASFVCVKQGGSTFNCTSTSNMGVIYTSIVTLGRLERNGLNNLFSSYEFCIEASDQAGNSSKECGIEIAIPQWEGQEPEPPKPIPTSIGRALKDFFDDTGIIIDDTFKNFNEYTLQDIGTTTTIATITIGFATLIGGFLSIPLFLLQLFLNLISWLGLRKRGVYSGYVYDSSTKDPISQAIIRVYKDGKNLVWTDVTDERGLFELALEDGKYTIKVLIRGYRFPTEVIYGKSDYPLENVYHGEVFEVVNEIVPEFSIPIDPLDLNWFEKAITSLDSRLRVLYKFMSAILFLFGLVFSVYLYNRNPSWFNFIIILLYIPSFILVVIALFKRKTKYGIVRNQHGEPVSGVSVGLRDMEYESIVSKRITDGKGRYRFVVNDGEYQLEILETEYEIVSVEKEDHEKLRDGSLLVASDIEIKPVKVEN